MNCVKKGISDGLLGAEELMVVLPSIGQEWFLVDIGAFWHASLGATAKKVLILWGQRTKDDFSYWNEGPGKGEIHFPICTNDARKPHEQQG